MGRQLFRMPLANILVMCGDVPPTVVNIHDFTGHMVEGVIRMRNIYLKLCNMK